MTGTSETTFSPNSATNRAMIATILWRGSSSPVVNYLMKFTDVNQDAYYGEAVRWAASEGIVTGYSENIFGTNDSITREQLATMLYRYAKANNYDVSDKSDITSYSDYSKIGSYAIEAMQWANAQNLITGMGNGTLNPKGQATRAQVATILMRFSQIK